ncbi:hypothetical protein V2H45_06270 [Tumidithrix elongata RA019]|uniref:Uncharacterized protein n=1 Tax=Tumidithrix elongata BACA0141 TaxID=2716417 RepID=A0AAW9PR70_9CYAN|nr:hypothetical protein [Tumidithrix elongata RA019]
MKFQPHNHHESARELNNELKNELKDEPILCPHCRRTASNGIKCQGICVADSSY